MSNLAYKYQQKPYEESQQQPSSSKLFQRKITKGEKILWSFAAVALLVAAIYLVSTYASIYALNSDIQQLETKTHQQEKGNNDLKQQVSTLNAPERILKIAKNKLGMTVKNGNVKVLGDD